MSYNNKKRKEPLETVIASIEKKYGSLDKLKDQSKKYINLKNNYKRQNIKTNELDEEHPLLKKAYLDFVKHTNTSRKLRKIKATITPDSHIADSISQRDSSSKSIQRPILKRPIVTPASVATTLSSNTSSSVNQCSANDLTCNSTTNIHSPYSNLTSSIVASTNRQFATPTTVISPFRSTSVAHQQIHQNNAIISNSSNTRYRSAASCCQHSIQNVLATNASSSIASTLTSSMIQSISSHDDTHYTQGDNDETSHPSVDDTNTTRMSCNNPFNRNDDVEDMPFDENEHVDVYTTESCSNCKRVANTSNDMNNFYNIKTKCFKRRQIKDRRKFRHIKCRAIVYTACNDDEYYLCDECATFLTTDDKDATSFKYVWPSFYWKLLTNEEILYSPSGALKLWKLVPMEWRSWWFEPLVQSASNHYNAITMSFPPPLFTDKTSSLNAMTDLLKTEFLPNIKEACNKYLMPTVLCPWGCTNYVHSAGFCDLDLVIQRYLPEFIITLCSDIKKLKLLTSSRDDYVRDIENEQYDSLLFNPKWKVLPSLAFIDGQPAILSCRKHDGGCRHHYIHPPRQPGGHILQSKHGDQLCHAVMKPRTIKQVKAKQYSTSFQMHAQIGSFKGIDTCDVRSFGRFDFVSILLRESEGRSIVGRPDINCLLDKLSHNHVISKEVAKSMRDDALSLFPDKLKLDNYAYGSTYVPIEDAIKMQKELGKENTLRMTFDMRDDIAEKTLDARRHWPSSIYTCQKFDESGHGNYVCTIPKLRSSKREIDTKVTWIILSLISRIKELWMLTDACTLQESRWHGWILAYAGKNCFNHRGFDTRNPFRVNQVGSAKGLHERVAMIDRRRDDDTNENWWKLEDLSDMFMAHDRVEVTNKLDGVENICQDETNLVIIVNIYGTTLEGTRMEFPDEIYNGVYELRLLAHVNSLNAEGTKWNGKVISRHGGRFKSWWYQERNQSIPTHAKNGKNSFPAYSPQFAVYVRKANPDYTTIKNDFLKSIGGQTHVRCQTHKYPLVRSSHANKNKCSKCGKRKEHIRCPEPSCNTVLCKSCFDANDDERCTYIEPPPALTRTSIDVPNENEFQLEDDLDVMSVTSAWSYESDVEVADRSNVFSNDHDHYHESNIYDDDDTHDSFITYEESDSLQDILAGRGVLSDAEEENSDHKDVSRCEGNLSSHNDNYDGSDLHPLRLRFDKDLSENSSVLSGDSFLSDTGSLISCDESTEFQPSATTIIGLNDLDNFITTADDPDTLVHYVNEDEENEENQNIIPFTNSGEQPLQISEITPKVSYTRGHTIFNQWSSMLARDHNPINGSKNEINFIQNLCATIPGDSVPTLFPESTMFPGIFYHSGELGDIHGAIPSPLLSSPKPLHGFASVLDHTRNRLSLAGTSTSTNSSYVSLCYDQLSNLTASHEDSRLIMNRGMKVDKNNSSGLGIRGKGDTSLFDSVDSQRMVNNLCASQKYHKMDYFLTYTCNQAEHFGVCNIKNWVDSGSWSKYYPTMNFDNLADFEKQEIHESVIQASAPITLRNWLETRKLFIKYLLTSESSPFGPAGALFARDEYQADEGNLPHIHAMLKAKEGRTQEEIDKMIDLIRCSGGDIVRVDEVDLRIQEGYISCREEADKICELGCRILSHGECTHRCLRKVSHTDGSVSLECRKLNNLKVSEDNTKHTYQELPQRLTDDTIEVLRRVGLAEEKVVNEFGHESKFKSCHSYFHPKRHIPPTNPTKDLNMSPIETITFSQCKSMQNIQVLTKTNGCNKYCCKYVSLLKRENYVTTKSDPIEKNKITTESHHLHAPKVTSSGMAEEKEMKKKSGNKPLGRNISLNEMYHVMLGYAEVHTDMEFISVQTCPLELRAAVERTYKKTNGRNDDVQDGAYAGGAIMSQIIRQEKDFPEKRLHSETECLMLQSAVNSTLSIDKITKFSIRPPELKGIVRNPCNYFRWFKMETSVISDTLLRDDETLLNIDMFQSCWIDGMQHAVRVRKKAIPEVIQYIQQLNQPMDEVTNNMAIIFKKMQNLLQTDDDSDHEHNDEDAAFLEFAKANWIFDCKGSKHLPIPVTSQIKPTMGPRFILHIMLTLGEFDTELDLTSHRSLRDSLEYAGLIGPSREIEDLQLYSNRLLRRYIEEEVVYYPSGSRAVCNYIETAADLFNEVIINDKMPIHDIPPALQSTIDERVDEAKTKEWELYRKNIAKALNVELLPLRDTYEVPTEVELRNATRENQVEWDAYSCFEKTNHQSNESFAEQQKAIKYGTDSINQYLNVFGHGAYFLKCKIFEGAPGAGKSLCMMYIAAYALAKGLRIVTTALQANRALTLGGSHIHHLFAIDVFNKSSAGNDNNSHRLAECALINLSKQPVKLFVLQTMDLLFVDEIGQVSAQLLSVLDMIMRKVKDNDIFMGGVLMICTMDHKQLEPVTGKPFLLSSHIVSCFSVIRLQHSVRASTDLNFQKLQVISRMSPNDITDDIVNEFETLLSNTCTFVHDWSSPEITPSTVRFYAKRLPALQATKDFIENMKTTISAQHRRERDSEDVQKQSSSREDWVTASTTVSNALDKKCRKLAKKILFFKGGVYEFTFNKPNQFSTTQIAILLNLPRQEDLNNFRPIKVLAAPIGTKDVEYDEDKCLEDYQAEGWQEVLLSTAPERTYKVQGNVQARRKQYGLKHRVSSTIHEGMGATLIRAAMQISDCDSNLKWWDKAQVIVALSRTKIGINTIFVGNKNETIKALSRLIRQKNQYTDYMESILDLVTVNLTNDDRDNGTSRTIYQPTNYPFRICDISLPNCNTGFVYFLMSIRNPNFTYIGQTICVSRRIRQHNSGYGSNSTTPLPLRPYACLAYITGFDGRHREARENIEREWKRKRDFLCRNGNHNVYDWVGAGKDCIEDLYVANELLRHLDLRLVMLFEN